MADATLETDFTGGARLGLFNATWPFAALTIGEDEIRLEVLWKELIFPKSEITTIRRCWGLFSAGAEIRHRTNAPDLIIFWTWNWSGIARTLRALGYPVS